LGGNSAALHCRPVSFGGLNNWLPTESCRQKAEKAIKYEGQIAIQSSFQIFGQVTAQELFSSPDVAAAVADLEKHLDGES